MRYVTGVVGRRHDRASVRKRELNAKRLSSPYRKQQSEARCLRLRSKVHRITRISGCRFGARDCRSNALRAEQEAIDAEEIFPALTERAQIIRPGACGVLAQWLGRIAREQRDHAVAVGLRLVG